MIGVVGRGGVNTSLLILCVGSDIIRAGVDGLVGGGVLGLSSLVGRVWCRSSAGGDQTLDVALASSFPIAAVVASLRRLSLFIRREVAPGRYW